ncbi:uncharacterized protein STEHIDRAFT_56805 [Stereum hirsutum FP-91666 SS1]|uniref:uncharacterized protein n=1 Tax=Stereum hirsutum (strain FP-91666) TaxID=721885 RepID=UPI000441002B|nr:uncharacterized protein STEHIDRAFT_56805 [Stereum hirsutum FP-91666 SS1]EIM87653.1 hypothetical protein STEHIDRAFT_56805 [Stereum hirsutum FP-91666 SS1]
MAEVEAPASLEINDALFCQHFKEVCTDCGVDTREENDAFFGFDPIDREGLEAPAATVTKDGTYQCKKHGSPCAYRSKMLRHSACNQCYGWKKQITRARTAAKKAGKKA